MFQFYNIFRPGLGGKGEVFQSGVGWDGVKIFFRGLGRGIFVGQGFCGEDFSARGVGR